MSSIIKLAGNIQEMEEFEALPDGPYPAELRDIEVRYSEKVPTGYIYAQYRIDPADFPVDYDVGNAPEGLPVTYASVKIPDPANRRTVKPFKGFLAAHGVKVSGTDFDTEKMIGKRVQLTLTRQEYQGSPVNNVLSIGPLPTV